MAHGHQLRGLSDYCYDAAGGDPLGALSLALRFVEKNGTTNLMKARAKRDGWKIGRPRTRRAS